MNLLFILFGSIIQSSTSALLSIVSVFPLMYMMQSFSEKLRSCFYSFFLMIAIMPSTVAAMSIATFYSTPGMGAVILVHVLLNIPLVFHLLYWDFIRVDFTLYPVARCLGAGRIRSYYDGLLLPLLPSLISAFTVVFILCFSSASIPLLLGDSAWSNTLDSAIVLLYQAGDTKSIWICVLLRAAAVLTVVFLGFRLSKSKHLSYKTVPLHDSTVIPIHKGWLVLGGVIMLALLFPVASLWARFIVRVSCYQQKIGTMFGESLLLIVMRSFFIAVASGIMAISIALICIYTESRYAVLFSTIPWLIGGSACAVICRLFAFYAPLPSLALVVLCHGLLCFPFVMRMITVALNQYNKEWTAYARSCGATRWQIFVTLKLSYLKEVLCTAWSLSLGLSVAQVGVAQLLVDSTGMTLPVAVRILKAQGLIDGAIILSICSMMLVFIPTFFVYWATSFYWKSTQPTSSKSVLFSTSNSGIVVKRKQLQHSL